jgi:hypothetical protein
LSTFTANELLPYEDFVSLAVISNAMTLSRTDLKKKARTFAFIHLPHPLMFK